MDTGSSWDGHIPSTPVLLKDMVMDMGSSWDGHIPYTSALHQDVAMEMGSSYDGHSPSTQPPTLLKDAVMKTGSLQGGCWVWGLWWERDWLCLLTCFPCVAAGHPPLLLGL